MIESMTELTAGEGFEEASKGQPGQVHIERFWPKSASRDGRTQHDVQTDRYQSVAR
jgi:hypothetical protein